MGSLLVAVCGLMARGCSGGGDDHGSGSSNGGKVVVIAFVDLICWYFLGSGDGSFVRSY